MYGKSLLLFEDMLVCLEELRVICKIAYKSIS